MTNLLASSNLIANGYYAQQTHKIEQSTSPANQRNENIDKMAESFESMFLGQIVQQLYSETDVGSWFGEGPGSETFKKMLFDEYGKVIANAGGIGIADHVKKQLQELQEIGNGNFK